MRKPIDVFGDWVNGKQALKDAKSTEVMAGKVVRGPGFVAKNN